MFALPVGEVNEVLVLCSESLNSILISFKLSGNILHGVQDEYSLRNIVVPMSSEPVREYTVWCFGFPI
jgi:hypothetical protein